MVFLQVVYTVPTTAADESQRCGGFNGQAAGGGNGGGGGGTQPEAKRPKAA